ncbi:MAG: hypoxanthine phosphoribosyltransferase [Eubacteriaceae bacterium]|nr:hypoxanthine phosphoribosyltransferase [Eubacteriaceae bacterium]
MNTGETVGDVMITQKEIEKRAGEIGGQITKDYKGENVILIGILRGAVMWMTDLMKNIDLDLEIDFMACSSYGAATKTSGVVKINKDLDSDIEGKHVIIVEDIVDSGITLSYLKGYLANRNPKSIKICSLLDKPEGRRTDLNADYVGFTVEDKFIVGYGLDFNQKYRQLPYISCLAD